VGLVRIMDGVRLVELKDDSHEPEVQTNISTCIPDSKDIPTAMSLFSGSGNTIEWDMV